MAEIETPFYTAITYRVERVRLRQPEYERYTRVPCHRSFVPGPFVILYIFITPLHHRVPMHSLHGLFLLSFSRLSFHLRGHAHFVPVTVHRYLRSA